MRSSESGQASTEYVGVLALLAVVFALAATAVAAPDLPGAVVHQLKLGLCLVGGDVCRERDARALGLGPCVLTARGEARDVGVGIVVDAGHSKSYEVQVLSDGTVIVRGFDGGRLDGSLGPSAKLGPVLTVGAQVGAGLSFQRGREWHLPSVEAANALLTAIRDPLRNLADDGDIHRNTGRRAPVRYLEGGVRLGLGLEAELGDERTGLRLRGVSVDRRAALGRRVGPDGTTVYYELDGETTGLLTDLVPGLGGHSAWVAEWHEHEVTLRTTTGTDDRGRRVEHVVHLPLDDPEDRRAALRFVLLEPVPGLGAAAARAFNARVRERGTVEVLTYEERSRTHGADVEAKLGGLALGGSYEHESFERELVGAEVLVGGRKVRREDCLGTL